MSPDARDALVHRERTAFCKLFGAMQKLAEIPLSDAASVGAHRRNVAAFKTYWARLLAMLDRQAAGPDR